jgi:hypothetical protein
MRVKLFELVKKNNKIQEILIVKLNYKNQTKFNKIR